MKKFWDSMPAFVKIAASFLLVVWFGWMTFWFATGQTAVILGWLTAFTVIAGITTGVWLFIKFIDWVTD